MHWQLFRPLLPGSWVVLNRVINRVTLLISRIRGPTYHYPRTSTHSTQIESESRCYKMLPCRKQGFRGLGV